MFDRVLNNRPLILVFSIFRAVGFSFQCMPKMISVILEVVSIGKRSYSNWQHLLIGEELLLTL